MFPELEWSRTHRLSFAGLLKDQPIGKSVMHVHMTNFWTIVLGIIGSIMGGGVTHMFSRSANERYHPAGLILSTLDGRDPDSLTFALG
jgi:hypothetical protein